MNSLEEIIKEEIIEITVEKITRDEWDDNFGDHSICSF